MKQRKPAGLMTLAPRPPVHSEHQPGCSLLTDSKNEAWSVWGELLP